MKPKITPGTFEMMTGQSLYVLNQPYPVHNIPLIIATRGCSGDTGLPVKLSMICGIYDTYIAIQVKVANLLINFRYLTRLGSTASLPVGYSPLSTLYLITNHLPGRSLYYTTSINPKKATLITLSSIFS